MAHLWRKHIMKIVRLLIFVTMLNLSNNRQVCEICRIDIATVCRVFLLCGDDVSKNENSHDADPYDLLYVVGAFDTICKTCQQQYCSAGVWTGEEFDKVC